MDRTKATASNKIEDSSAACIPSTNEAARELLRLNPVPRNIWKAMSRGMAMEVMNKATAKLHTIPMLDMVLSNPEVIP